MLDDRYTLIIPTYNRPAELRLLVDFLLRQRVDFPVIVLDSSNADVKALNRELVAKSGAQFSYEQYDESTHPFDKFRDGVSRVRTPFCQLCADDDLIFVDGIGRCVERLAGDESLVAAHGYYFMFLDQGQQVMEIPRLLYFTPDNVDSDPILRLRELFRSYQALTYAVYRREVLTHVFNRIRNVESILARELLSGALTVVQGGVARLDVFSHGRGLTPSSPYLHWHPLEWLIRSPNELFNEYLCYRKILVEDLGQFHGDRLANAEAIRRVDLVHLLYLSRHMPESTLDFAVERVLAGEDFDTIWSAHEIHIPLQRAARNLDPRLTASLKQQLRDLAWDTGRYLKRRVLGNQRPIRNPLLRPVRSPVREYRLHPEFFDHRPSSRAPIPPSQIQHLVNCMDMFGI